MNGRENDFENFVYEKTMKFELLQCSNIIYCILHHSVETPLIRIKHELKFCLSLSISRKNPVIELNINYVSM